MDRQTPCSAFQTNLPGPRDVPPREPPVCRFKVDSLVDAFAPSGQKVMKCYRWDGQNLGTRPYMVAPPGLSASPSAVGDEVFAAIVGGGTGYSYVGSSSGAVRQVLWRSLNDGLGNPQYQYEEPWSQQQNKWAWGMGPVVIPPVIS